MKFLQIFLFSFSTVIFSVEAPVKISFGSCLGQNRSMQILETIAAGRPDAFLFLGDNVYADSEKPSEIQAAYQQLASSDAFVKLRDSTRVLAVWDDHDYGLNDAGRHFTAREKSEQIFESFWDGMHPSPRKNRAGVYSSYWLEKNGFLVHIIMLDTRFFRSDLLREKINDKEQYVPDYTSSGKTMLGDQQWQWFTRQLSRVAHVTIIASSIQILPREHRYEKWHNLPHQRVKLLNAIHGAELSNVILISGDRHFAEIMQVEYRNRLFTEVTSSSLNWPYNYAIEQNINRKGGAYRSQNFGMIDIKRAENFIRLSINDIAGSAVNSIVLPFQK